MLLTRYPQCCAKVASSLLSDSGRPWGEHSNILAIAVPRYCLRPVPPFAAVLDVRKRMALMPTLLLGLSGQT